MNKLQTIFATAVLAISATQASAATTTWTFSGTVGTGFNACDLLGCEKGAAGETRFLIDDSNISDGNITAADFIGGELWTTLGGVLVLTDSFDGTALHTGHAGGGILLTFTGTDVVTGFEAHSDGKAPFPLISWDGGSTMAIGLGQTCETVSMIQGALGNEAGCNVGSSTSFLVNGSWSTDNTVAASAVPVPAAAWLFGSAILGLVGVGRKRRA